MSFSGGVYTLPSGNPVVTGTTISSSWANTTLSDIATALSTCVLKDGTQTITANIPMSNFKFTGLAAGSSTQDSATIGGTETLTSKTLTAPTITNPANTKQALTDGATINWDASSGAVATVTLGGNRTMAAPSNLKTGGRYVLLVTQDGTGGRTLTWNAVFVAQGSATMPQPASTAASVSVFVFDSPDGTNLYLNQGESLIDANPLLYNVTDVTKKLRVTLTGISTATTRLWTVQDYNIAPGKYPTRTVLVTGGATGTYTVPTGCIYINVQLVGGGGGGAAATANNGTTGNSSTFGALTAGGGTNGTVGGSGGGGGTASGGDINIPGGAGAGGNDNTAGSAVVMPGAQGGNGRFGGGGAGGIGAGDGGNAATNSGGGGGGAGNSGTVTTGSGGGAGGFVQKLYTAATSYAYTVAQSAAGGAAGTHAGGNGAAGIIIIDEFYS